jgi:hypothetical protein
MHLQNCAVALIVPTYYPGKSGDWRRLPEKTKAYGRKGAKAAFLESSAGLSKTLVFKSQSGVPKLLMSASRRSESRSARV